MSNKANYSAAELTGALTAGGTPPPSVEWNDPVMRHCVATVHAAEPSAVINDPVTATASTPVTWNAPETACQQLALFEDIVKAAGKTLNNATFNRAGQSLTHVTLPGGGGTYDFGPGHREGDDRCSSSNGTPPRGSSRRKPRSADRVVGPLDGALPIRPLQWDSLPCKPA